MKVDMSITKEKSRKTTNSLTDEDYEAIFSAVLAVDDFDAVLEYDSMKIESSDETDDQPNDRLEQNEIAENNLLPDHYHHHHHHDGSEDGDDNDNRMDAEALDDLPADVSAELAQITNEATPSASDAEEDVDKLPIPPPKIWHHKHTTQKKNRVVPRRLEFPKDTHRHILKDVTNDPLNELHKRSVHKRKRSAKRSRKFMQDRKINELGTWVQCTSSVCSKWRYLANVHDPTILPEYWTCCMNEDENYNSCSIAQEEFDQAEHDAIYTFVKFTEGSVVWAKMAGFPWWPALVEIDPDTKEYIDCRYITTAASHYHVVFLDEKVSRAWISKDKLQPLTFESDIQQFGPWTFSGVNYKKRVLQAWNEAQEALHLSLADRLQSYGFSQRFKGKWAAEMSASSQEVDDELEEKTLHDEDCNEDLKKDSMAEEEEDDEEMIREDEEMRREEEEEWRLDIEGDCKERKDDDDSEVDEKIKKKAKKEKKLKRKNEDDVESEPLKKPKVKTTEKTRKKEKVAKDAVHVGSKSLDRPKQKLSIHKGKAINKLTTTNAPQFGVKVKPSFKAPVMNAYNENYKVGEKPAKISQSLTSKREMERLNGDTSNDSAKVPLFSKKASRKNDASVTKACDSKNRNKNISSSNAKCTISSHKSESVSAECAISSIKPKGIIKNDITKKIVSDKLKTKSIIKDDKRVFAADELKPKSITKDDNAKGVTSASNPKSITKDNNAKSVTSAGKPKSITKDDNAKSVTSAGKPKSITKDDNPKSVTSAGKPKSITKDDNANSVTSAGKPKSITKDDNAKSVTSAVKPKCITKKEDKSKSVTSAGKPKSITKDDNIKSVTPADKPKSITKENDDKSVTPTDTPTSITKENIAQSVTSTDIPKSITKNNAKSVTSAVKSKSITKKNDDNSVTPDKSKTKSIVKAKCAVSDNCSEKIKAVSKVKSTFVVPQIGEKKIMADYKRLAKDKSSGGQENSSMAELQDKDKLQTLQERLLTTKKQCDKESSKCEKSKPIERYEHDDDNELDLDGFIEPNEADLEKLVEEMEASSSQPFEIDEEQLLNDEPITKLADISADIYDSDPLDLEE